MAIQVEMWQSEIKEQLFESNQFLNHMKNADEYVVGGKSVHIPQSGGPAAVQVNRSSLPAPIQVRTDTVITYSLKEYTTDPVRIDNADTVELSYNKMQSVIRENSGYLMEYVGNDLLYEVTQNVPAANKVATTGADAAATASGATGNRKILTEADIRKARVLMDNMKVPNADRYLMISPDMLNHLSDDEKLKYAFQKTIDLPTGVVTQLFGFNILVRPTTLTLAADLSLKTPTAASAIDDLDAALFWQKDYLERALGDITMFDEYGRPEYYGDIFSTLVRAGGRNCRADDKGYGVIYGAASA